MLLLASFPSFLSPYAPKALAQALLSPRHLSSFFLCILCIPLTPLSSLAATGAAPEHHLHTQVLLDVQIFPFGCFLHTDLFVLKVSSLKLHTQNAIPPPCPVPGFSCSSRGGGTGAGSPLPPQGEGRRMSHSWVQLPRKEQRGSSSHVFHWEWWDKCSKPELLRGK